MSDDSDPKVCPTCGQPINHRCGVCNLPVDIGRSGAVRHGDGWAHDVCARRAKESR